MAESQARNAHFLNPWALHLQKLGLELKCSLCLKEYNKPMLLPCDHIFCSSCVPKSNLFGLDCPLCKVPYVEQDLRRAPFIENVVSIYKSMDASFSTHMLNSDSRRGNTKFSNQVKRQIESSPPGNSNSGTCGNMEQYEAVDVEMNQMESSPDSPPSSDVSKGVDANCREPGSSYDSVGKCPTKKSAKRTADDYGVQEKSSDQFGKKQKQLLSQGQPQNCQGSMTPSTAELQIAASAGSDMTNTGKDSSNQVVIYDTANLINYVCAFCHTWKTTEGSGPMQHFDNEREVFGSEAGQSHIMHVHQSCIEWAPQIYYENDTTMKNLDKELARAGKLKCTSCGLKGAALGCFAKSCRKTYHVPCAYEIAGCRWDMDKFLMLCPAHASQKFPGERFKKPVVKKCSSTQISIEQKSVCDLDFWATSPTGAKNWVLCGSALSADEKYKLVKFANLCGATVTKAWTPDVTHVVAATDANGACSRTLKVLMAILNGRWVLNIDWVEACMQSKCPVDEATYEIILDNHGCCDGPKTGRLRVLKNAPQLFSSLRFFFIAGFVEAYKNDLQNLVKAAGGTILKSEEQLQQFNNESSHPSTTILVYNDDTTGEVNEVLQQQLMVQQLALENGSQVIAHTWILDSIASGALQPFV
ncbi:BRCA1-associated RING domain protein 1-like [Chenopodium quinoa]|uniref:BRCA1-associated RING domain protein 1-like n=1 Tax=Chenopodium quinoa TaxID=63459 RepID=UPI000B793AF8|nr:BRCA1-associated RING domain protein 1-like [Chenopodium quinoa]